MILFSAMLRSIIFKGVLLSIVWQEVIEAAYPYSSATAAAAAPSAAGATATAVGGPATGFSNPGIGGGPTGGASGPGPSAGGPTGPVGPSGPPTGPVGGSGPGPLGPTGPVGPGPTGPVSGPGPFGPTGPIAGPGGPGPFGPGGFGFGPSGPVGFGPGPGQFGPGFGPGPFGPAPFGPGPFGPAPFGPGPYGPAFYRWLLGLANYSLPGFLKYKAFGAKALKSNFLGRFPPFPPYPFPVAFAYPGHGNLLFPNSFGNKALALIQKHYTKLVEPVVMGVLGALGMWIFRAIVLPKLPIIVKKEVARSLVSNDSGAVETLADTVTSAISRGICLQHIACEFGLMVRPLPRQVIETLGKNVSTNSGLGFFIKVANSTEITSCEAYSCRKEQTSLKDSGDHFTSDNSSVSYDDSKK